MKIALTMLFLLFGTPLLSQTAENVLLVLNEASPISMDIGLYYAQKRGISQSNLLRIKMVTQEEISRKDFERQINAPIANWLQQNFAQDRILYIVLTKGIPIRVAGTSGTHGTVASVDSELTLLYRKMVGGQDIPVAGTVKNPYFLGDAPIAQAKQFSHATHDIYLVSRLDGYNSADVRALIDRGSAPSKDGKILLDARGEPGTKGDIWLRQAANLLNGMGFSGRVILDTSAKVLTGIKQVLGYYSWGSNDPAIRIRHFGFEFVPGALAGMFVSSDGRTFQESEWKIGDSGYPQSLAADLIHDGVTGIAAHVAEPFLEATIRPDILFPSYLSGFNLIESYYLSMPYLSWQTIVVGDPLCAPFRTASLAPKEIDKGIDPETELPVDFGQRRFIAVSLAAYKKAGIHPDTIKFILRSEARLAKKDQAGACKALEEAIARDDRLPLQQLQLAGLYEAAGEYDKSIDRYRQLQKLAPNNALVLNNLAYALAVRKHDLQEALPLAERAHLLANKEPNITDTLGWVYHLAGQDEKAVKLLEEATRLEGASAEVHLHMAIVSAAIGNTLAAGVSLSRALEIDPKLEQREEVKELRAKLK